MLRSLGFGNCSFIDSFYSSQIELACTRTSFKTFPFVSTWRVCNDIIYTCLKYLPYWSNFEQILSFFPTFFLFKIWNFWISFFHLLGSIKKYFVFIRLINYDLLELNSILSKNFQINVVRIWLSHHIYNLGESLWRYLYLYLFGLRLFSASHNADRSTSIQAP